MIWWWRLECNEAWTPLLVTKLGWSVKIKSMQEELLVWMCVGSLTIWWKPFDVLNEKSFVASNESMPLDHQEVDLTLKSPNMTDTDGLRLLMSDKRCSNFVKKLSNSSLFGLGEWQRLDIITFCFDHLILRVMPLEDKLNSLP